MYFLEARVLDEPLAFHNDGLVHLVADDDSLDGPLVAPLVHTYFLQLLPLHDGFDAGMSLRTFFSAAGDPAAPSCA